MRAWLMESYDGVEKMRLGEVPDPEPGPGLALLRVRFAAINPADAFLAQAMYPARPPLPHVLGRDGVGEVLALGPGAVNARVGETVGILRGSTGVEEWGTLAEKVVVPDGSIVPIPQGWSLEEMAGGQHLTHAVAPEDVRQRRPGRVHRLRQKRIRRIDRREPHPEQRLPRPGLRIRHVAQAEFLDAFE